MPGSNSLPLEESEVYVENERVDAGIPFFSIVRTFCYNLEVLQAIYIMAELAALPCKGEYKKFIIFYIQ